MPPPRLVLEVGGDFNFAGSHAWSDPAVIQIKKIFFAEVAKKSPICGNSASGSFSAAKKTILANLSKLLKTTYSSQYEVFMLNAKTEY